MENVTLTMSITAAEAARAGVDQFGETTVVVRPSELSPGARAIFAALSGKPVDSRCWVRGHSVLPVPIPTDTGTVSQWLEANAAKLDVYAAQQAAAHAASQEAERKAVREWADKPDEKLVQFNTQLATPYQVSVPYSYPDDMNEFVRARKAKAQVLADLKNGEFTENKARIEAEKKAQSVRRAEQLKHWLVTQGSESMRRRAARGLLPEEDLIAAIRNEAFAPLDGLTRYERMTDDDVRQELDAEEADQGVDYITRGAESAHDEDIALMEQIESLLPGATCTLLEHVGWLTDADGKDDPEALRYAVKVAIKVGELEFTREYAAGK